MENLATSSSISRALYARGVTFEFIYLFSLHKQTDPMRFTHSNTDVHMGLLTAAHSNTHTRKHNAARGQRRSLMRRKLRGTCWKTQINCTDRHEGTHVCSHDFSHEEDHRFLTGRRATHRFTDEGRIYSLILITPPVVVAMKSLNKQEADLVAELDSYVQRFMVPRRVAVGNSKWWKLQSFQPWRHRDLFLLIMLNLVA